MSDRPRIGRLHVITDVAVQNRYSHEELAALACEGGADVVQLRDKLLAGEDFVAAARRIAAICAAHGVVFIVNDRVEAALAADADGVHLGRDDAPLATARTALGARALIGASTGSSEEVLAAGRAGADYVGFGHVFPTASKRKAAPPVGLDALGRACAVARVPVIAIGGIDAENAEDVLRAGAWGVAVIGAVCAADDPRAATARLREIVGRYLR